VGPGDNLIWTRRDDAFDVERLATPDLRSALLAQVEQVLAEKAKLVTRTDVTAVLATNVIRAPAAVRGAA
jgi:hypothetical protein